MKEKIITLIILILITLCGAGFVHSKISEKSDLKNYKIALSEYKKENYQASYKYFGKISLFSDIKPPAIFRRARSATLLGDYSAAKRNYKSLLFRFPNSQLYVVSEYNLASLLYEQNSRSAKKHFLHIIKYFPHTDYALASEYYVASIDMNKANKTRFYWKRKKLKNKALSHFIRYVKLSPDGRFAQQSIDNIENLGIVISPEDNLAIANSYFKREQYKQASNYYAKSPFKNSWAKYSLNELKNNNLEYAEKIINKGLENASAELEKEDVYNTIDEYISTKSDKITTINTLINKYPKSIYADYFTYLKAKYTTNETEQYKLFENIFTLYPNSTFSAEALYKVFYSNVNKKHYDEAIKLGQKHLASFQTSDTAPAVMFWMGKIYEYKNNSSLAKSYYRGVISKYPDSYYSYRAYCQLHKNKDIFISKKIKQKPIEFPCSDRHEQKMASKLIDVGDYDFVSELYKENQFVQSWIDYKEGNIVQSVITAQKEMEETYPKPKFDDAKWRLVYPLNFYNYVDKYRGEEDGLMILSIIREESHFNSNIESPVGAIGLMQLMPATANEIASIHNLDNNLYNPENNIRLGSLYYSKMKASLWDKDIYAVMAYNGGWYSVDNWLKKLNFIDIDDFVEKIPYPETQTYVKKVFKSYWMYSNIYK